MRRNSKPDAAALGKKRARPILLYVEDDDDNWATTELCIGREFDLLRAASDQQACQIMRDRSAEIAATLIDVELRGSKLSGLELTGLFRGRLSDNASLPDFAREVPVFQKPIIYLTAHGVRYSDAQLIETGADRVVTKPVNFSSLTVLLNELLQLRPSA